MALKDSIPAAAAAANAEQVTPSKLPALQIPLQLLDPSPYQYRSTMDPEKFAELKRSIHDSGQLVALTVRPSPKTEGRWEIICGHRRVEALRQLLEASTDQFQRSRFNTAKVNQIPKDTPEELVERMVIEDNAHREDTDPLDDSRAILNYMKRNSINQEQAAANLHFEVTRFRRLLKIATAPAIIQKALRPGLMVPALGDDGEQLTKADGSPRHEHRRLDVTAAGSFIKLFEYYEKNLTPKKAEVRLASTLERALARNWTLRRIQTHVANTCAGKPDATTDSAPEAVPTAKRIPAPWKDSETTFTIYKRVLPSLSSAEKDELRALLEKLLAVAPEGSQSPS